MENNGLIGTKIGAYLIQAKLGEGGMAQVYKAYHDRLRREVAIKVILPQVADQLGFRERFEREAQLVASLEHRNIVAVYDFGETPDGKLTYLVMQYVGGGTLRDLLRRQGRIEPHKAVLYTIQMARALHHAHQRGIVHRDVKPQNMLISTSDSSEILLSDFGIAKIFDSSSQETMLPPTAGSIRHDPSLTNVDQMVGTAEYMAPEQINRQPVDARTDVYALGIVLFQMLAGQIPFSSTTVQGLLFQHVYTPPVPIRAVNPSVPVVVEQIIARALAKSPEQRYQSAEAMAVALEAIHTPSTHELSSTGIDNSATFVRPSSEASTYLSQNPSGAMPALYSNYGQQNPPAVSAGQAFPTNTAVGSVVAAPSKPRRRRSTITNLLYVVISLAALALLFGNFVLPWTCKTYNLFCLSPLPPASGTNTQFTTDNFQNNNNNWTVGNLGNLNANLSNNQYTLTLSNTGTSTTYFPHPAPLGTANGPLPTNFTLKAEMEQTQGAPNAFYGIAFRLQGSDANVTSYAFIVDSQGDYALTKYVANNGHNATSGQSALIHALNTFNTLEVIVRGSTFSFKINDQVVPINGPNKSDQTYTDTSQTLTGGQLGILVAGSNATFVVKSVILTTQ